MTTTNRHKSLRTIFSRKPKHVEFPKDAQGNYLKASELYGQLVFDYKSSKKLTSEDKQKIAEVLSGNKNLDRELADKFAASLLEWATDHGVTHFCHWFQPLTGSTAEKHDAFLDLDGTRAIEELSGKQLAKGEPDASSFPNGGFRNTYEARGYTSWDLTSDIFIRESENGKILYIPTGFVTYDGHALDVKTPLLRSTDALNTAATTFYQEAGLDISGVTVNSGAEQEYFLVDKHLFYQRPDLVMSGRALVGTLPTRNQQLDDHYFGSVPARVLAFMNDLEVKLYKVGIPAKTRHNEVAPGQFEIASIYKSANQTADNNHLLMSLLKEVAEKHGFVCLLHEKPFAGINGSGKHINWSISTSEGKNLLNPTAEPHKNASFLATLAIVIEAVHRHAEMLRVSIASHSNDHRLGANEAPPSIISIFLGDTLTKVCDSIEKGENFEGGTLADLDLGSGGLAAILQDNTDRNRTSPFAFTGNKFEFRAVGSTASIGVPMTILNAAVADVFNESTKLLKEYKDAGQSSEEAMLTLTKHWYTHAKAVVFNGDGYSDDWITEAEGRGLSNLRTSADAFECLYDDKYTNFLKELKIFKTQELSTYANVFFERYNMQRDIEFRTLADMVNKYILPYTLNYKTNVCQAIKAMKDIGESAEAEKEILKNINFYQAILTTNTNNLVESMNSYESLDPREYARKIVDELLPYSEKVAEASNKLESIIPDGEWGLPTVYDMLFIR